MARIARWLIIALTIFFAGCNEKTAYEGKIDFPERCWVFRQPATFEFEIVDVDSTYEVLVDVRYAGTYQFQNIYLQYYLEDDEGMLYSKDLKNIQLFNAKTGIPLGGGLGDLYSIEKPILENHRFVKPGKYRFRIDQFMRQDTLQGILSVGIKVQLTG
jgi:gliding motility-associated lipoprotein GldH